MTSSHEFLNRTVSVKIDRPLGSQHRQHGFIYPVNYGYVPNTPTPDGDDLDDDDDKLIIVPEGKSYSDEQIQALIEFQERFFRSISLR